MQQRLTLTLDHNALRLDPDDVILYRVSPSIGRPPLFEPGPDYEPKSPAWIAALVPASDGGTDMLWARAFRLNFEAQEKRWAQAAADQEAAEKAAKDALQNKAIDILSALAGDVLGDSTVLPGGMAWPDLRRCVKACRLKPYEWSRVACEEALWRWARQRAREQTP
jgi:hypothetical protein